MDAIEIKMNKNSMFCPLIRGQFAGNPVRIRSSLSLLYKGRKQHKSTGETWEGAAGRRNLSQDI